MSQKVYDAIVVGGGPAGVSLAYTLGKLGKSVILLDKKKQDQIGNKTCGDALDGKSPTILKEAFGLDMPHGEEVSDVLTKMAIVTPSTKLYLDAPGFTINRLEYGQRLLQECIDIGVEVIPQAPVREVIIEDGFVKGVRYVGTDGKVELRAKIVADCSGYVASVRNKLPEGFSEGLHARLPDHHVAASYREIVDLKEEHPYPNEIVLIYDNRLPPPGYLWLFSKGKKRLNMGTGWLKSENVNFDKSMKEIYLEVLEDYYKRDIDYTVDIAGGGLIPIRPPFDTLTFNGGVVIGDAACLVDPTTAEGHGPALVAGYYAGKAISDAIDRDDVSREGLWKYNIDTMAHYGRQFAISYISLQYLRVIQADGMDYFLKKRVLIQEDLLVVFNGESPKLSFIEMLKRAKRAFPRLDLLWGLKKLISNVNRIGDHYDNYPSDPKDLPAWIELRDKILGEKL